MEFEADLENESSCLLDLAGDIKQENEDELEDESNSAMYPEIELKVKSDIFICYVCGKSFGNNGDMKKHVIRIHESVPGSVVCDECPKTFKNTADLYHHKAQVHTHEILKCERCFVDCKNKNALRKHEKKCSQKEVPTPIIFCQFCDQTFSIHKTLYKHLKQQHNHVGREFKCDVCGKQYDRKVNLTRHLKKHHGDYTKDPIRTKSATVMGSVECSERKIHTQPANIEDSEPSPSKESVMINSDHVNTSSGFNDFGYQYRLPEVKPPEVNPPDFKYGLHYGHHYAHHYALAQSYNAFQTTSDPISRKHVSDIIDHIKTETPIVKTEGKHSDENGEELLDEDRDMFDEQNFASMIEQHAHNVRNQEEVANNYNLDLKTDTVKQEATTHLCDICARYFAHKTALNKHILSVHRKEEVNAVCEICSKVFKYKHLLQYHTRDVHSTQLFSCEVCGKTFKSKSYLSRHLERHTTELIHPCPLCGKTFSNKSYLRHHHNAVHKLEDHPCETCGKTYKNKYLLRKHVNKYHVIKQ